MPTFPEPDCAIGLACDKAEPIQKLSGGMQLGRHRHAGGYVAVVMDGSFCEFGDLGRISAQAGDVIVHGRWEAHRDVVASKGAWVTNLAADTRIEPGVYRSAALDVILAAAAGGAMCEAVAMCEQTLARVALPMDDWPELLVAAIHRDPALSITDWAAGHGLRPPEVSRTFAARYGVSPKRFRAEAKARAALRHICEGAGQLASIALESGFSDQAHMTRAISAMTGESPGRWREGRDRETANARAAPQRP